MRRWIQTAAFVRKESFEILRQPRLLIPLVIGPFLIMLLFGIGYRNEGRQLRTLYVVTPGDPIRQQIEKFAPNIGPQLKFEGITTNLNEARKELRQRKVDLLIIAPPDASDTIRHNERATFVLNHSEVDPYQADYIRFTGELYTDKLNNLLLKQAADQWKSQMGTLKTELKTLNDSSQKLRTIMQQGNEMAFQEAQARIQKRAEKVQAQLLDQYQVVDDWADPDHSANAENIQALGDQLLDFGAVVDDLGKDEQIQTHADEIQEALRLEANIQNITNAINHFEGMDTRVLISPFRSQAESILPEQPQISHFFAPGVIVLLLQHLCVTFAALSIVREFRSGTMELFRVSPLSSWEILTGKYLGYIVVIGIISIVLTGLLFWGLKIPMRGSWIQYGITILALSFTSLGIGFLFSLLATTDTQAIQYSMMLFLTSIFFCGFLMPLQLLWEPVRVVSYALPATYGIQLLQNIILRGSTHSNGTWIAMLSISGVILFVVCYMMLRRKVAQG
jgi:ABC-2 type transport system permease protein